MIMHRRRCQIWEGMWSRVYGKGLAKELFIPMNGREEKIMEKR